MKKSATSQTQSHVEVAVKLTTTQYEDEFYSA